MLRGMEALTLVTYPKYGKLTSKQPNGLSESLLKKAPDQQSQAIKKLLYY
jgi:hypothetical protein